MTQSIACRWPATMHGTRKRCGTTSGSGAGLHKDGFPCGGSYIRICSRVDGESACICVVRSWVTMKPRTTGRVWHFGFDAESCGNVSKASPFFWPCSQHPAASRATLPCPNLFTLERKPTSEIPCPPTVNPKVWGLGFARPGLTRSLSPKPQSRASNCGNFWTEQECLRIFGNQAVLTHECKFRVHLSTPSTTLLGIRA